MPRFQANTGMCQKGAEKNGSLTWTGDREDVLSFSQIKTGENSKEKVLPSPAQKGPNCTTNGELVCERSERSTERRKVKVLGTGRIGSYKKGCHPQGAGRQVCRERSCFSLT